MPGSTNPLIRSIELYAAGLILNNCVNSILHLEDKNLTYYAGNYEKFAETRMAQLESKLSEIKKQYKTRQHLQSFVDRFRYKAKKAKQAKLFI